MIDNTYAKTMALQAEASATRYARCHDALIESIGARDFAQARRWLHNAAEHYCAAAHFACEAEASDYACEATQVARAYRTALATAFRRAWDQALDAGVRP